MQARKKYLGVAVAAICALGAGASFAQQAPAAQKVEKIEVTGSNIKRIDAETSSPIVIITAEEIKRSGATSVQELLNNLSIAQGGALSDISGGNGFSPGTSTVALRGLGSQSTLTLLNGRRISPAAFTDPNTGSSVITNLNSIPATAIERIEILKDGASAVYGSDAIAGVVNIILRRDFTGALLGATVSQNGDSEFLTRQVNVALGFGDLARDRYNVFVNYERFERDPVLIRDNDNVDDRYAFLGTNPPGLNRRSVLSSFSFPGNLLRESVPGSGNFNTIALARPGCAIVTANLCRYNQWDDLEQSGKTIRDTGYARGSYDFSASLSAFGEVSFSKATNTFTGAPPTGTPAITTWLSNTGQQLRFALVLPVGHPDNPFNFRAGLRYRFVELGRAQTISVTEDSRVLAGLKGTVGRWDWESSFLHNTSKQTSSSGRTLLFPEVQNAINDSSLRFNGTMNQAMIDRISARATDSGKSTTSIWDLKGSAEFGSLPGGAIAAAGGLEFRRDELKITPDANIVASRFVGLGASFANGSRNVSSAFVEASLPITKSIEGTLAGRFDRYSDYGSSSNPRIGVKWKALPSLAARANYSTGFRAPSLSQISSSSVRSFQNIGRDPIRCPVTADDDDCNRIVASQIQFNPNLEPEKSKSATIGIVWDATKDTGVTMDFFKIRRNNEIDRFSSAFVVTRNFRGEARFANSVLRDPNPLSWLPGVPNSGPIQTVLRQYLNLGGTEVSGIDLDIVHRLNLGEMGKLRLSGSGTYNISNKFAREKSDVMTEAIGGINLPRARGNLAASWDYQDWIVGARYNYVGQYAYRDGFGTCEDYLGTAAIANVPGICTIRSWQTIDVNATYTGFKNLTLGLVIRNINDYKPPFDYNANTVLGYNTAYHNPQGINGAFSATYRFK